MVITAATGTDTINAVIANGSTFGTGGGVTGVTKSGAGTLVLGGANTYTGGTVVSGGTLLVNNSAGSGTGTGTVRLAAGTLGGSGAVAGTVLAGGSAHRIHPGETRGANTATTLTIGGLTTNGNTTLDFNLVTPGASDLINVTGADMLTLGGGTLAFTNHATGPGSLGFYKILEYVGNIQGAGAGSLSLPGVVSGVVYTLDATRDPGFIEVHRGFLGDADDNGVVNFADFVAMSNHYGIANAHWTDGDFNADGVVNFADFVILSNQYGQAVGGSSLTVSGEDRAAFEAAAAGFGVTAVPEPGALALMAVGTAVLLVKGARSRGGRR
jgi:fibronectin-binding autotransporter adhesin